MLPGPPAGGLSSARGQDLVSGTRDFHPPAGGTRGGRLPAGPTAAPPPGISTGAGAWGSRSPSRPSSACSRTTSPLFRGEIRGFSIFFYKLYNLPPLGSPPTPDLFYGREPGPGSGRLPSAQPRPAPWNSPGAGSLPRARPTSPLFRGEIRGFTIFFFYKLYNLPPVGSLPTTDLFYGRWSGPGWHSGRLLPGITATDPLEGCYGVGLSRCAACPALRRMSIFMATSLPRT